MPESAGAAASNRQKTQPTFRQTGQRTLLLNEISTEVESLRCRKSSTPMVGDTIQAKSIEVVRGLRFS